MINRKTFLAAVFLILVPVEAPGQNRNVLQGLDMVKVVVDINDDGGRFVSNSQIETEVEETLRRNQIVVARDAEPFIHVAITAIEITTEYLGFSVCINVELNELVTLNRDSSKIEFATTWKAGSTILVFPDRSSATQGVRRIVREYIDGFSNDYLAVNPITR